MAITRVQSANAASSGAATSLGVTLSSTPTNGNFLVALIATSGTTTGRVSSISQTGATWVQAIEKVNNMTIEIWYAENVSSAGTSITINLASSIVSTAIIVEYSGIIASSSLDKTASDSGTYPNTVLSGTTATTAQAEELWIAALGDNQVIGTAWAAATNSFTEIVESNNVGVGLVGEEKIVNSTGTANTSVDHVSPPLSGEFAGVISTFIGGIRQGRVVVLKAPGII